jgi:hypothetical protein
MRTRYDTAQIKQVTTDPQTGFMHVTNVPIARVGVFPYMKADRSIEMEAKLPTELLSDSTVNSADNRPVTNDHHGLVTKDNATQLAKGFTADNAHVDDNTLRVDMTIMDGKLIDAINNGKQELSIGFQTNIDQTPGEYNGVAYDSVQKDIQINHVAVVNQGRAGHTVRLLGDSAEMIDDDVKEGKTESMEYTKTRLDSVDQTITVADHDVDAVTKLDADNSDKSKKIADLKDQIAELQKQLDELQGNADESKKDAAKAQAKADSLEKENENMKNKYEGDGFDKKVQARLKLMEKAKKFVGDSADLNKMSAREMKIAAVKSAKAVNDSINLEDQTDDYIQALFDNLKEPATVVGYRGTSAQYKGDSAENEALKLRAERYSKGGNR